jgi:hypothetical protein
MFQNKCMIKECTDGGLMSINGGQMIQSRQKLSRIF